MHLRKYEYNSKQIEQDCERIASTVAGAQERAKRVIDNSNYAKH